MIQDLEIIISAGATLLGLSATTLTFLVKTIKNTKAKKKAERLLMISEAILPYIKQAENYVNYSGEEKKEYVLTKANQFCIEKGLKFDMQQAGQKIEELVELTKNVNARSQSANLVSDNTTINTQKPVTANSFFYPKRV